MPRAQQQRSIAGYCSLLAGVAWVTWAWLNTRTHGGLDAGSAAVGEPMARAGQLLMVAWNLFLIPAALALPEQLVGARATRLSLARICGLASLLFWAYGGATRSITPALEVSYIALSAVWWGGVGAEAWKSNRWFGALTLALAAFAGWDALLTALEPVPFGLYLTAAPKLPLSILWDFAVAFVLLRAAPGTVTGAEFRARHALPNYSFLHARMTAILPRRHRDAETRAEDLRTKLQTLFSFRR